MDLTNRISLFFAAALLIYGDRHRRERLTGNAPGTGKSGGGQP
jgi:hypothetical protein